MLYSWRYSEAVPAERGNGVGGLSRVPMNLEAYHEEMLTQSKHLNYALWERADLVIVPARVPKQLVNETGSAGAIL